MTIALDPRLIPLAERLQAAVIRQVELLEQGEPHLNPEQLQALIQWVLESIVDGADQVPVLVSFGLGLGYPDDDETQEPLLLLGDPETRDVEVAFPLVGVAGIARVFCQAAVQHSKLLGLDGVDETMMKDASDLCGHVSRSINEQI